MKPRSAPLNVLVIAVGGNVSQGILKALRRSSVPCRVIGTDISPLQFGLFTVDRAYIGPWAHEAGFLEWLYGLCRAESVDVILTGAEPVLRALCAHKESIESETGALCLISSREVWSISDDKLLTCRWLRDNGYNYPRFADMSDIGDVQNLVAELGYPLLAKPRMGGAAQGVLEVRDEFDLAYVRRKSHYLLQEFLPDSQAEYTVGCFSDSSGSIAGSITMWRELVAGTTYRAVVGEFPEVRAEAEKICAVLRPMGPCNVQLRVTERGPVCFEINARFSGTTPLRAFFGFNEVDAALRHFVLGERVVRLPRVTSGVALRYWNELYANLEAVDLLERGRVLTAPSQTPSRIEDYGIKPNLGSGGFNGGIGS